MTLIGTKAIPLTRDSGEFPCPTCGDFRFFLHKTVRKFATLCRVPVFPLERMGEFIECQGCGGRFAMELIGTDPTPRIERERWEFARHVVWVMVLVGLDDGDLDEAERSAIRDVHQKLAGVPLDEEEIEKEIAQATRASVGPPDYVRRFVEAFREHGRAEYTLRAALYVAGDDGHLDESRRSALMLLADALEIPRPAAEKILDRVSQTNP